MAGGCILSYVNQNRQYTNLLNASLGILRWNERPWDNVKEKKDIDWKVSKQHLGLKTAKYTQHPDGKWYAPGIEWFAQKGDRFGPYFEPWRYRSKHFIPFNGKHDKRVIHEEVFFSTEGDKNDHCPADDAHNQGNTETCGILTFDLNKSTIFEEYEQFLDVFGEGDEKLWVVEIQLEARTSLRIEAPNK